MTSHGLSLCHEQGEVVLGVSIRRACIRHRSESGAIAARRDVGGTASERSCLFGPDHDQRMFGQLCCRPIGRERIGETADGRTSNTSKGMTRSRRARQPKRAGTTLDTGSFAVQVFSQSVPLSSRYTFSNPSVVPSRRTVSVRRKRSPGARFRPFGSCVRTHDPRTLSTTAMGSPSAWAASTDPQSGPAASVNTPSHRSHEHLEGSRPRALRKAISEKPGPWQHARHGPHHLGCDTLSQP